MTREQLISMLPEGVENGVVTAVLDALHAEIKPFKDAAKQAADDLAAKIAENAEINKNAATAEEKAKAFDELQAKYDADLKAANDRIAAIEFDGMIDGILREKGARSIKAARALLNLEELRGSQNQKADALSAIESLMAAEDSAFIFNAEPTGGKGGVGTPVGKPVPLADGVEAAIQALNPNLNI